MDHRRIVAAVALFALPACGPTKDSGDGAGEGGTSGADESADQSSQEGGSSGVMSTDCVVGDVTYPDGAQFDTPDGCYTFECQASQPKVVEDRSTAWPGDLTLATQAELDEQTCLASVSGALTLTGSVSDTTALARLVNVGGQLSVIGSQITAITLNPLQEVGDAIIIADNPALTSMAFQPTLSVFGDVEIRNNDALVSLNGAQFIGQCSGCGAHVDGTPGELAGSARPAYGDDVADSGPDGGVPEPGDGGAQAEDGSDEPGGGIFYGSITIADNDALTDIFAMGNLVFAWSNLVFSNNASLVDLYALNVTEVQGDFEVSNHPAMTQTAAMDVVTGTDVWGQIRVCGNAGADACPQ